MKIEALSQKTLGATEELLLDVFDTSPDDFDYPPKWLPAAIEPKQHVELLKDFHNQFYKVWVMLDEGKVIGVNGLYALGSDASEAYWLAWFAVAKDSRGKGVGSKLLEFCIDRARKDGKKYLRLYTSDSEIEQDAQKLYDQFGFRIVDSKKFNELYKNFEKHGEKESETRIFRELKL